jgi:hypothetical protein
VYVINLDEDAAIWGLHDICDTVRYKDVADRVTAAPAPAVDEDAAHGAHNMVVDIPSVRQ